MENEITEELFPQIQIERDQGGIVRKVFTRDLIFPTVIKSETLFNWLGKPQEMKKTSFGIERRVQFSPEGRPITERINLFDEVILENNYNPLTGEYLNSFLEVEDD